MHDPRIGRFFAVDPLTAKYPWYTPYQFSGNKVIHMVELEGLEEALSPLYQEAFSAASHGASSEEMQEMMNYYMVGYAAGFTILFVPAAASKFISATESIIMNAAVWGSNPANQALMVEGAGFIGALFYDGPEDLSPGGGDELGKIFKKALTPAINAVEYLFKSGTADEISTGTAKVVNGILELDFYVPSDLQGKGIGTVMFNDAVQSLDDITGIRGLWTQNSASGPSTNLTEFWNMADDIYTDAQAALNTPTGKWAAANGYTEVKFIARERDEVEVIFSKPQE